MQLKLLQSAVTVPTEKYINYLFWELLCLGVHAQMRAYSDLVVCLSSVTGVSVPLVKFKYSICFYVLNIILSWI